MIWNAVYMEDPYQIRDLLYKPVEQHLWYLYAMIPIYLVLPFFQVMCKGMNLRMERAFLVACDEGENDSGRYFCSMHGIKLWADLCGNLTGWRTL